MTAVDPRAKDDMKRLIAIMNQGVAFDEPSYNPQTPLAESSSSEIDPKEDMKRIMLAFSGAGSLDAVNDPAARLADRAERDLELREALVTELTDRGTRVGSWEILTMENDSGLRTFDILNIQTQEPIASELTLYDAALGITRCLNEGGTINSRTIREILNTEAQYSKNRQDAANFKARMESATDYSRKAIMEDRYVDALTKTKEARIHLSSLINANDRRR